MRKENVRNSVDKTRDDVKLACLLSERRFSLLIGHITLNNFVVCCYF
jgi:hypothetical protein